MVRNSKGALLSKADHEHTECTDTGIGRKMLIFLLLNFPIGVYVIAYIALDSFGDLSEQITEYAKVAMIVGIIGTNMSALALYFSAEHQGRPLVPQTLWNGVPHCDSCNNSLLGVRVSWAASFGCAIFTVVWIIVNYV